EWGNPNEDAILADAQAYRLGYFAWSWSGNDPSYQYLDLVHNFTPGSLTPWGRRFIDGPNGLHTATREATIYRNTGTAIEVSNVTSDSVRLTWPRSSGRAWLTSYQVVAVDGSGERGLLSTDSPTATVTRLSPSSEYTFAVYSRDLIGHRSARSA